MIDIVEGDILVVAGREYPVKIAAEWVGKGNTASFRRLATVSASTKRTGTSGGKRSAPTAYLSDLKITPLDPISASAIKSIELSANELLTPNELKQCYVADSTGFLHLVVEDQKR
jgi:hypothetical protein